MLDITGIISQVVLAILGLLAAWFTTKALPWLKARTSKAKWDFWLTVVTTAVRAAEEIYWQEGQGELKYQYVEGVLLKAGIVLDAEKVRELIKAAVQNLRLEKAYAAPLPLPPGTLDKEALMNTDISPAQG